jgi:hypothetical protein
MQGRLLASPEYEFVCKTPGHRPGLWHKTVVPLCTHHIASDGGTPQHLPTPPLTVMQGRTIILTSCPHYNSSYSSSTGSSKQPKPDGNGYCPPSRVTLRDTDENGEKQFPLEIETVSQD